MPLPVALGRQATVFLSPERASGNEGEADDVESCALERVGRSFRIQSLEMAERLNLGLCRQAKVAEGQKRWAGALRVTDG